MLPCSPNMSATCCCVRLQILRLLLESHPEDFNGIHANALVVRTAKLYKRMQPAERTAMQKAGWLDLLQALVLAYLPQESGLSAVGPPDAVLLPSSAASSSSSCNRSEGASGAAGLEAGSGSAQVAPATLPRYLSREYVNTLYSFAQVRQLWTDSVSYPLAHVPRRLCRKLGGWI